MKAWVNDALVEAACATVSIFDRGFLYGDGLFETIPVYDGRAFALSAHVRRLQSGAVALKFDAPPEAHSIEAAVLATIDANALQAGVVRVALSRGLSGRNGLACGGTGSHTIVVTCSEPRPYSNEVRENGVSLHISDICHALPASLPTMFKHANYLQSILAKDEAAAAGAFESLLLNPLGRICEGATSNFFAVRNREVLTPPLADGPLAGITREIVLSLAASAGMGAREQSLEVEDLHAIEECFITNSSMGILPVCSIGQLATYPPGFVTRILMNLYWAKVSAEAGRPWFDSP